MTDTQIVTPATRELLVPGKGTVHNRTAQLVLEGEREVVRLDARPGHGIAWWHGVAFDTGTIAFEVRGKNELQRSFVGIAFHGACGGEEPDDLSHGDGLSCEAVYFRPFNFLSEDPERRSHMVQYVFPSEHHWQPLRERRPGQFEATVTPIPDPDDWFSARVVVSERTVSVYVNACDTPSLVAQRLCARRGGWVGYWVGHGSDGAFSGLTIKAATATHGS
jgi:hypothetical protein